MKLSSAFICIDCDEIFASANCCPNCSSEIIFPLCRWIEPYMERDPVSTTPDAHLGYVGTD